MKSKFPPLIRRDIREQEQNGLFPVLLPTHAVPVREQGVFDRGAVAVREILRLVPPEEAGFKGEIPFSRPACCRQLPNRFDPLGAVICLLYYRKRKDDRKLRLVWLYILLSFLFYLPVAVGAGLVPLLGMLMLPKTVCYILLIVAFLRSSAREEINSEHL